MSPVPRVKINKVNDEETISEGDPREKYPPANEEEKKNIEITRSKLS